MSRTIAIAVGRRPQADGIAPATTREELERSDRRDDVGRPSTARSSTRPLNPARPTVPPPSDPPTTTASTPHRSHHGIDLLTYTPLGDKKNSEFFEEYLPEGVRTPRRQRPRRDRRGRWRRSSSRSSTATPSTTSPSSRSWARTDSSTLALDRHPPGVPAALPARVPPADRARAAERRRTRTRSPAGTSCTRCRKHKPNARYIGEIYKADVGRRGPRRARAAEHPLRVPGRPGEPLLLPRPPDLHVPVRLHLQPGRLRRRRPRRPRRRSASASGSRCRPTSRPRSTPPPRCRRSTASPAWCSASTTWPPASSPASARTPSSST